MFLVNQEILSEKNNPKLWDWYQSKIKEIKDGKKEYYQFNTTKNANFQDTDKGKMKIRKFKTIPLTCVLENEEFGSQTWEYAASASSIVNDRGYAKLRRSNNFLFSNETLLSSKKDYEIIFFILNISNYLERSILFLKDTDKENKALAEANALKFEVGYLISSPSSPISPEKLGTEDLFRTLCIAWGVQDVSNKPIYQLKNELQDAVGTSQANLSQTNRGYELFIKECHSYGDSELRSNVMLAIERNVLVYDDLYWKLKGRGGNEVIVETMEPQHKSKAVDILVKKFSDNKTLQSLLLEVINPGAEQVVISEKNQHELRSELMEEGYDFKALKKLKVAELNTLLSEVIKCKKEGKTIPVLE